ncbi:hypothetical protein B0A49_09648 [Cryomyces minteri]|uniref:Histone chaperone domain-containing protein n=1 Tax=Cryomyces minteri TaxID=331657 RepID=A0A4U0WHL5_9PEZI|nr:hypothetical protein B0A49_09648 [Cryomyces minteri]
MSDSNGAQTLKPTDTSTESTSPAVDKGKGKAIQAEDVSMDEEEDSSDESASEKEGQEPELEEDNMEEIDPDNIVSGPRRTRANIDFAKANAEMDAEGGAEDEDEDDDEDFQDEEDEMKE